jgi:hypothetical protein
MRKFIKPIAILVAVNAIPFKENPEPKTHQEYETEPSYLEARTIAVVSGSVVSSAEIAAMRATTARRRRATKRRLQTAPDCIPAYVSTVSSSQLSR